MSVRNYQASSYPSPSTYKAVSYKIKVSKLCQIVDIKIDLGYKTKKAARRTTWRRTRIQRRRRQGLYANLFPKLNAEDPEMFRRCRRLEIDCFKTVLDIVSPLIKKQDTNMRPSISPGERLVITLRFLVTRM